MSFDIGKFRERFPQFADKDKYPDGVIQTMYDMASIFISTEDSPCHTLNGKQLELALELMTAHLLFINYADSQNGADPNGGGGMGGPEAGGAITSATIGEISVSRLAPPAKDGWEWWLSSTPYGTQLWAVLQVLAVGGFAIGGLPEREGFRKVGGVFW